MSKEIRTILHCDVCEREAVGTWRLFPIKQDARDIDLCAEHAKPLEGLYKKARPRRKVAPDVVQPRKAGTRTLRTGG